jgi:hypothetical protein
VKHHYLIEKELFEKAWNYILDRPTREVFQLVAELRAGAKLVEIPDDAQAPNAILPEKSEQEVGETSGTGQA